MTQSQAPHAESPSLALFRQALGHRYEAGELRAIARLIMKQAFGVPDIDLYADKVRQFSTEEHVRLTEILTRLEKGEPVQYVLGEAQFDGHSFHVMPGVLIPRPETEELVAWVAADLARSPMASLLDVGTGSGCIAVSLACRLCRTAVTAWDISSEALQVAKQNALRHGVTVCFNRQDLFEAPPTGWRQWDAIVSNPPYVCETERAEMEAHVLEHEPALALFVPDEDPLRYYRALARLAHSTLRPGGALYVEINSRFGNETAALFEQEGLKRIELRKDAFGADRFIKARL